MTSSPPQYPIIDSHIHLFPSSELETHAWASPSGPLYSQHSLAEYASATGLPPSLEGFIFLETDRINDLEAGAVDGSGWEMPLMEVDWMRRIATGAPKEGEGHVAEDQKYCQGIVPWAPLPSGEVVLEKYVAEVEKRAGGAWGKVRGFRYLVQDKSRGTMLGEGFVEGLRWMGRKGFVFDLGVDQRSGGRWQLEEAVEMIERAYEGVMEEEKVAFIINHICKPDLSVYNQTDPAFVAWRTAIFKLSKFNKIYMKLSGCFSEMPDQLKAGTVDDIFDALQPYLVVILATFGPFRIMFGSDWPVCTVGVDNAWKKWRAVVQRFCDVASLDQEQRIMIWSGTAIKAYNLTELM
ncbi:hypothetical protein BJ878DRAFT_478004 [Calycina marina]|uniref:Amidohydrolase-related domain-containing protein n=1 Tax=Calycina marina TaxID=1763456 RepID=A0A9P8CHH3_9HELO|nr:hypothetical protein BJ878DRAFT_478004 [Calycina marina]